MIFVNYPISAFDCGQFINHPNDFQKLYDLSKSDEALKAYLALLAQFDYARMLHYNMGSTSRSTFFENADDFVDDLNSEEFDPSNGWMLNLNLTEDAIRNILEDYKRDFIIVKADGKATTFGDGDRKEVVVYGEFESAVEDMDKDHGDKLLCLLSIPTKDYDDAYETHVFAMEYDNVHEVGEPFLTSRIASKWFEQVTERFASDKDGEKTYELIVNGLKKCEIKCDAENEKVVKKTLTQLGIFSAFHGYNFQFNEKH